jgi:phage gp46-like protein
MSESRVLENGMHGSIGYVATGKASLNGEMGDTPIKETCGIESVRPAEQAKPVAYLTPIRTRNRGWWSSSWHRDRYGSSLQCHRLRRSLSQYSQDWESLRSSSMNRP